MEYYVAIKELHRCKCILTHYSVMHSVLSDIIYVMYRRIIIKYGKNDRFKMCVYTTSAGC